MRLFCLPFGGGGASAFARWGISLAPAVEVCPIQLPGREERYRDTAYTNFVLLGRDMAEEIRPYLEKPFAIFGHSMGAVIGFELCRALRVAGLPSPQILFVAAYQSPDAPMVKRSLFKLPDDAFIEELRLLEGTPAAILDNPEVMQFVLPTLRADFQGCDEYGYTVEPPLDTPIVAYCGEQDKAIKPEMMEKWGAHTSREFELKILAGNHFFPQTNREELLADIRSCLSRGSGDTPVSPRF